MKANQRTSVDIISIERRPVGAAAEYAFIVEMDTPDGPQSVCASTDALLDYATFQREALKQAGWLYRHAACEGRPAPAANEAWRWVVQNFLLHAALSNSPQN